MMTIRRSDERGRANHGWLDSRFTFSFAEYYDPAFMGFRDLRVINEDRVQPNRGFGMHPHRDMEILSWPLSGQLEHGDSLGHTRVVSHGEVQRMSAGTGVVHSERNPSLTEPVHFLQIWIRPDRAGIEPEYEQRAIPIEQRNVLHEIAAGRPQSGGMTIHQDAAILVTAIDPGASVRHELASGRHAWVQVVRGTIELNGERLEQGDGAAVSEERHLDLRAVDDSEVLVFDLV